MVTLAVEESTPEAHKEAKNRHEGLVLVGGFVLFALLAVLFETEPLARGFDVALICLILAGVLVVMLEHVP